MCRVGVKASSEAIAPSGSDPLPRDARPSFPRVPIRCREARGHRPSGSDPLPRDARPSFPRVPIRCREARGHRPSGSDPLPRGARPSCAAFREGRLLRAMSVPRAGAPAAPSATASPAGVVAAVAPRLGSAATQPLLSRAATTPRRGACASRLAAWLPATDSSSSRRYSRPRSSHCRTGRLVREQDLLAPRRVT